MSTVYADTQQEALLRLRTLLERPAAEADDVQALLDGLDRAAINAMDHDAAGDTVLHIAARGGNPVIVQLLLTAGADPLARNAKGRTPGKQLNIDEDVRTELDVAAAAQRADKDAARTAVWSEAMKRTQTESAFGLQTL